MSVRFVVVTVLASVALFACEGENDSLERTAPTAATTSITMSPTSPGSRGSFFGPAERPPRYVELIGTWKPLKLYGRDMRGMRHVNGQRPVITFLRYWSKPGWRAYDGCNWTSGRLHLQRSGEYSLSRVGSTLKACSPTPKAAMNVLVVQDSNWLGLRKDRLMFFDEDGDVLGTYARTHPGIGVLARES